MLDPHAQVHDGYQNHATGQADGEAPAVPTLAQIEDGGDDDEREQDHLDRTLHAGARRRRRSPEEQE
jgi:hypothetical protein